MDAEDPSEPGVSSRSVLAIDRPTEKLDIAGPTRPLGRELAMKDSSPATKGTTQSAGNLINITELLSLSCFQTTATGKPH